MAFQRLPAYLRFVGRYIGANLQGALEYRLSFVSQVVAMLITDLTWLIFWIAYFGAFPLVAGWDRTDIITLWAVVAVGFGLGAAFFGGAFRLSNMITRGEIHAADEQMEQRRATSYSACWSMGCWSGQVHCRSRSLRSSR
jgi:ABC-type uncharacterized transport system permease subunit